MIARLSKFPFRANWNVLKSIVCLRRVPLREPIKMKIASVVIYVGWLKNMSDRPLFQRFVKDRAEQCNLFFRSVLLNQFSFRVKDTLQVQFQCKGLTLSELRGNAVDICNRMFLIRNIVNRFSLRFPDRSRIQKESLDSNNTVSIRFWDAVLRTKLFDKIRLYPLP